MGWAIFYAAPCMLRTGLSVPQQGSRFGQLGLGLFGGICDSANSGNSPLLGRGSGAAGEEEGVFRGVSNGQRLIGWWWELRY